MTETGAQVRKPIRYFSSDWGNSVTLSEMLNLSDFRSDLHNFSSAFGLKDLLIKPNRL